jgi:hypothetical protein
MMDFSKPFRGASLPEDMRAVLAPTIEQQGASTVLRAMVLAWQRTPPAAQAELLALAESPEEAVYQMQSRGLGAPSGVTPEEIEAAAQDLERARAVFRPSEHLTHDELLVATRRIGVRLRDRPSLEEVGRELGGASRQEVEATEKRAREKLMGWLARLLSAQRLTAP